MTNIICKRRIAKLTVSLEAAPTGGITENQVEETKTALRELGLNDDVKIE